MSLHSFDSRVAHVQPAGLDTNGVTLGYITDTVDSTRNCCMLKVSTHNAICMILFCYYEFERGCVQPTASRLLAFSCCLTHAPTQHRIPTKTLTKTLTKALIRWNFQYGKDG